jgi:hypothetical protein
VATRKDFFGCHGESPRLARRIKLKTYASSSPPQLRLCYGRQREYNAVSVERSMKFGSVVRVETLGHLTKIMAQASKNKVLAAKHTASLQLLYTVGGS